MPSDSYPYDYSFLFVKHNQPDRIQPNDQFRTGNISLWSNKLILTALVEYNQPKLQWSISKG